jgi:hypothetical protein
LVSALATGARDAGQRGAQAGAAGVVFVDWDPNGKFAVSSELFYFLSELSTSGARVRAHGRPGAQRLSGREISGRRGH